ncbi:MAG: cupin domain-containing protein [Chloroflexi bacterium]|nr:cupin domain-containing protein [Chloroflexota bacterium]
METMMGLVIRESDSQWEGWADPVIGAKSPVRWKLLITGDRTPTKGLTIGIAEVPPGVSQLLHHHEPQEAYYVVEGAGTVELEGRALAIGPGSALFIPPNAKHRVINSGTAPLRFVFVFPTDTFEEIQYHYDE